MDKELNKQLRLIKIHILLNGLVKTDDNIYINKYLEMLDIIKCLKEYPFDDSVYGKSVKESHFYGIITEGYVGYGTDKYNVLFNYRNTNYEEIQPIHHNLHKTLRTSDMIFSKRNLIERMFKHVLFNNKDLWKQK